VAELALDVDRTLALLEQERCERVAQAMRREMRREIGPLEQPIKRAAHVALVQGGPEADDDYTPIARGRGEPSLQAEVAHRFGVKISQALQQSPVRRD